MIRAKRYIRRSVQFPQQKKPLINSIAWRAVQVGEGESSRQVTHLEVDVLGKWAVLADARGTVRVWDLTTVCAVGCICA